MHLFSEMMLSEIQVTVKGQCCICRSDFLIRQQLLNFISPK